MATFRSLVVFLALLGTCLAIPTTSPAGGAVDSRIDARDEFATVWGEICATDGPWGSAQGRWLKDYADEFGSRSGLAFQINSRSSNVCHQIACFADGVPGTIWACLRPGTVIAPNRQEKISYKQLFDATMRIYNRCPHTYTGRVLFQGQNQNWDIVVSGHSCDSIGPTDDLNDPYWGHS